MRKIVVHMGVSLDGFFEGPDRDISWHTMDDEMHAFINAYLATTSAFLFGRVTHELMADFWPAADQDPEVSGPMPEFAGIYRRIPRIVFSRTLEQDEWATSVHCEVDPEHIRSLQQQPGGDMTVGGADLIDAFRRHDLIDEYRLFVNPVLLGRGRPLFGPGDAPADLELVDSRRFGNGVVMLHHARRRG
ncbi:dihydrofolate reductase family protein [Blastococcus brunescens]|uniref:Dihydrofolate reductase family protein n=1 Tax=Blastococcus brunescens TaxID=1564165 RepID=A0ABZ1AWP2_9ACTN|nr:dihydrofolate reductase family protein [Blastococcus sp. BMG 8361]WRL62970.1 dihydrofolate reductase family protein [Blastococcus sp. BMG 8361]